MQILEKVGICPPSDFTTRPQGGVHLLKGVQFEEVISHSRFPNQTYVCNQPFILESSSIFDSEYPAFVAGQHFAHFGHFMSESVSRLNELNDLINSNTPIVWYGPRNHGSMKLNFALRDFVATYFGIDVSRIHTITKPTFFESVYFPKQTSILGHPNTSNEFKNRLRNLEFEFYSRSTETFQVSSKIFISRNRFPTKVAGESFLNRILESHGYETVYPETLSFQSQLTVLRNSKVIVCTEGSFLHNLELLGDIDVQLFVIMRRPSKLRSTQHILKLIKSRSAHPIFLTEPDYQLSISQKDITNSLGIYSYDRMLNFLSLMIDIRSPVLNDGYENYHRAVSLDAHQYFESFSGKRSQNLSIKSSNVFFKELDIILDRLQY